LLLLLSIATASPSLQVLLQVDDRGVALVSSQPTDAAPTPAHGPGTLPLTVLAADGTALATATAPDPRHRSVVFPDGGGASVQLLSATTRAVVPWPAGATTLVVDGARLAPTPTDSPDPEPIAARPPPAAAVPLIRSGDDDDRLDMVFLGDGYTADELDDFADDVDRMVDYLLQLEPYGTYDSLFNVWRIDAASAESGVTHLEGTPVERDTAYGCYYGCGGLDRLVCCDDAAVLGAVGEALPGADGVLVLVNDPAYGGSGGFTYATSYVGDDFGTEVAAHELGHTLVGLWDEYGYGIDGDDEGPNCSLDEQGTWDEWLGIDGVDAFPECSYNSLHRPTLDECMMRTLEEGYCPVCRQEAVLAMYERLPGLILDVSPPPGPVASTPPTFEVELVSDDVLDVEWRLDGERIATGARFSPSCFAASGALTVHVVDDTPWVRDDPDGLLEASEGPWLVSEGDCDDPATTASDPSATTRDDRGDDELALTCSCAMGRSPQATRPLWGSIAGWLALVPLWWSRRR